MGVHKSIVGPEVGESLPLIAWHPADESPLTVDYLVVAQG